MFARGGQPGHGCFWLAMTFGMGPEGCGILNVGGRSTHVRYLEVTIRCERSALEAVCALFDELTGGGYSVEDPLDIIENMPTWDMTDLVPGDPNWVTVKGWLADTEALEEKRLTLDRELADLRSLGLGQVESPGLKWVQEEDWATAWKAYYKPARIGRRMVVIPSWESFDLEPSDVPIYMDPGMAFGTGTHPTTALCLGWLDQLVRPGMRVMDAGTGSGILAIAAAKLGAGSVLAFDLDPVAVAVARENLARNPGAEQVQVEEGVIDAPFVAQWVAGGAPDLVVANIIPSVIALITPDVARLMPAGGLYLTSGILKEKQHEVLASVEDAGLSVVDSRGEGGWVAILARK